MNKQAFLAELENWLSGLPQEEMEERLTFYSEMIDDRMEEGLPEEEAVADIGTVDDIVSQILEEIPLSKIVKNKIKPKKKWSTREILLLVLGFPIWLPLLISAFAVVFSLYITFWAVILSLWSVFLALAVCPVAAAACSLVFLFLGNVTAGITIIGAGLLCAGLSVFSFFGCRAATNGLLLLSKKFVLAIKNRFVRKGESK